MPQKLDMRAGYEDYLVMRSGTAPEDYWRQVRNAAVARLDAPHDASLEPILALAILGATVAYGERFDRLNPNAIPALLKTVGHSVPPKPLVDIKRFIRSLPEDPHLVEDWAWVFFYSFSFLNSSGALY